MPRLPVISGARAVKALERAGWRADRQRGSHVVLLKTGHIASLSIPQHAELAPGTLRALNRAAGMSVDEAVSTRTVTRTFLVVWPTVKVNVPVVAG